MAKKCIPGVICLETITIFFIFFLILVILCFYFNYNSALNSRFFPPSSTSQTLATNSDKIVIVNNSPRSDSFNDPYYPPLKPNSYLLPSPQITSDIRSVPQIPINIETTGFSNRSYSQLGIITRNDESKEKLILPLMGRLLYNGRDKWQYYTISNTGMVNTKLPIRFKGRSCSCDIGCDEIYNNDTVYVEGYKETFSITLYENSNLSYIPVI